MTFGSRPLRHEDSVAYAAKLREAGVGVVYLYLTSSVRQTSESPPMYSGAGANPLHMPFAVLTLVAFICYGFALVRVRGLRTAGIVAIALSIVMLAQVTRQRDAFPPLFFYTVPFILGVRLLFRRLPRTAPGA